MLGLSEAVVTREGKFTDSRGTTFPYRRLDDQWQVRARKQLFDFATHEERLGDWQLRLNEAAAGFDEPKVSIEIEHGYYDETSLVITITGWRPAEVSEIKRIERQLKL